MNATDFVSLGLTNAAFSTLLALAGLLLTRLWTNPHVASFVWLVVLAKLVTPPLFALPLTLGELRDERRELRDDGRAAGVSLRVSHPAMVEAVPVEAPKPDPAPAIPSFETPIVAHDIPSTAGLDPVEARRPALPTTRPETPSRALAEPPVPIPAVVKAQPHVADLEPGFDWSLELSRYEIPGYVAIVWLAGTLIVGTVTLVRIRRFGRLLSRVAVSDDEVTRVIVRVAVRLGLKRCPPVRVVPGNLGPLVWAGALPPVVIVPRPLWNTVGDEERETLLAHELAHVVRRDHWVRRFEAVVLALFWWLPTAWFAIRQRESAAESCCDAIVLATFPERPQAYAEALFHAVSVHSTGRVAVLASGLGRTSELKERLAMILHNRIPRPPRRLTKILLYGAAAILLAVSTRFVQADPEGGRAAGVSRGVNQAPAPSFNRVISGGASDMSFDDPFAAMGSEMSGGYGSASAGDFGSDPFGDPFGDQLADATDAAMQFPPRPDEILFFNADWALHARQLTPLVEKLQQQGLPFRLVDVDQERELAKKMNVDSVPTFIALRDRKEIGRKVGVQSEQSLRDLAAQQPVPANGLRDKMLAGLAKVIDSPDEPENVKVQALRSYGRLARGGDTDQAEKLLLDAARQSENVMITLAAADALHALGSKQGVEMMWSLLGTKAESGDGTHGDIPYETIARLLNNAGEVPPTVESNQRLAGLATSQPQMEEMAGGMMGMGSPFGRRPAGPARQLLERLIESGEGISRLVQAIETAKDSMAMM